MILIASASASIRRRWSRGLQGAFPIHEVADRKALEWTMTNQKPTVLLLDISLPQLSGIEDVSEIQRLSPSTNIILLTSTSNDREAIRALMGGVKGYCSNDIEPFLLKKAIEVVQKGEIWVGRKIVPHILEEFTSLARRHQEASSEKPRANLESLTQREYQIAQSIGDGLSNREIAVRFKITERTVKAHLNSIFRKLNIMDRVRLALIVANYASAKA